MGEVYLLGYENGIADVYAQARKYKETGSRLIGIIGAGSKDRLVLEKEMQAVCDELFVTTNDGSYGGKVSVIDVLKELLEVIEKSTHTKYPDLVFAAGPATILGRISGLTGDFGIKTITREQNA